LDPVNFDSRLHNVGFFSEPTKVRKH
jgi:hypothetical protein